MIFKNNDDKIEYDMLMKELTIMHEENVIGLITINDMRVRISKLYSITKNARYKEGLLAVYDSLEKRVQR